MLAEIHAVRVRPLRAVTVTFLVFAPCVNAAIPFYSHTAMCATSPCFAAPTWHRIEMLDMCRIEMVDFEKNDLYVVHYRAVREKLRGRDVQLI